MQTGCRLPDSDPPACQPPGAKGPGSPAFHRDVDVAQRPGIVLQTLREEPRDLQDAVPRDPAALLLTCWPVALLCAMLLGMIRSAVFLLATLAGGQVVPSPSDLSRVAPGTLAPDFELPSAAGGNLKLSSLRGKIVVLVFYRGHW